ncbi:hypothetical protein [Amycolatopsis sp. 195334CR]|uniref:hypothetical protein n=1 Tax=Amycolatopsis sp. 195334CR TaxID=2814588 RepID=UPI001A8DA112|nr:hypothetical protein [Amycolatopsis sp. 195334CR]MBN6037442.1 hypothetical protein [Amycolatopsis sp. 195334CR]
MGRPEHAGALTPVLTALLAVDPSARPDASRAKALLELVSSGADEKTIRAAVGRRRPFRTAVGRRRSMRSAVGRGAAVGRLRAGVGHRDPLGSAVGHRDQLESAVGFRGRLGAAAGRRARLRLAGRRRGWRIAVASAVVVAAAAAVLVTVLPEDAPPPAAAPPFDARSADLCALLIPPALAEFGEVVPEPDRGEFSQCGLLVRTPSGASVDVTAELEPLSITGAPGEDRPGGFQLTRFAGEETGCERHLLPATHEYTVAISVTRRDGVGGPVEFCAIADVATDGALAVLASGRLPRRSVAPDPASLAWQNACSLLAEAAPGRDPVELDHGVGDWSCAHDSPIGPDTVQIRFTRDAPPSAGQKLVFGGRETWLEASTADPDSCVARIGYRTYPGPLGQPVAELIEVLADGVADDGACSVVVGTAQPLAYALAD